MATDRMTSKNGGGAGGSPYSFGLRKAKYTKKGLNNGPLAHKQVRGNKVVWSLSYKFNETRTHLHPR